MYKRIVFVVLVSLLFFVSVDSQAKGKKTSGKPELGRKVSAGITKKDGAVNIECKLSTLKNRNIFKLGRPIDFILSCSSEDSEYMFIPRRFLQGAADFRPHIVLETENGVQYELLNYQFAFSQKDSKFKALKSESLLYQFRFPDEKGRYRVVNKREWEETDIHTIEEREDIFGVSFAEIPPGKYKAWVDLRHEWKTVKIGRTFMIIENYNNYDGRAEIISWRIGDITPSIEIEVQEKRSFWAK